MHDPVAMPNAARIWPELRCGECLQAAEGADLVLHLTEWADYRAINPVALAAVVAQPVLVDARCTLDTELWLASGWRVRVPGRPLADQVDMSDRAYP